MSENNKEQEPERDPSRWVDEHGDYLFRFAMLRVQNSSVAEDLVQETFLSALKSIGAFSGGAGIRTWLTTILKNKIIDYFRKQKVRKEDDAASDLIDEKRWLFQEEGRWVGVWKVDLGPSGWGAGPSAEFERREFWNALQKCLAKLPEGVSRLFVLREIEEMETEEICKILEITPSNLWVSLHRARLRLRHCLESTWFSERAAKDKD
jgi:RNA polymerase sigma-70 factor (ECF subfamily)